MARLWRVGLILVGMASLAACKAKAQAPKSVVLDDFERAPISGNRQFDPAEALRQPTYPNNDFDLATSGYATLTPVNKDAARAAKDKALYKFIQGKTAAKVRFTVPSDYRKKSDERFPITWETGFGISTDSRTPLKQTDWSAFRFLSFRVFNPVAKAQTLTVRFNDSASASTRTAVVIPQGESEVELPLDQLGDARLNLADIRGVTLFLDTANQGVDPVLIFDQLALYDTDAATRIKLAAEEGADESGDDEDWDEEEEGVRKVNVVHPGDVTATAAAVSVSPAAQ
jgi:hypothetical protein